MVDLNNIEEQVSAIIKELMEELACYSKEIAQIMYAKQLVATEVQIAIPEGSGIAEKKIESSNQRLKKMIDEAKLKLEYASNSQLKQVNEMEELICISNEKIKKLYEA